MATRRDPLRSSTEGVDTWSGEPVDVAPLQQNPPEWGGWQPPAGTAPPADYWIPPTASFGDDPSGKINRENPYAQADKPFVQAGTTGGYQVGKGITRRAGTSQTQAEYDAAMEAARGSEWGGQLDEWLARNPDDPHRFLEAMVDTTGNDGGDGGGIGFPLGMRPGGGGNQSDLYRALQNLWGGDQNQSIINSRLSNARDMLNRQRKSTLASNQALLANRGLMGAPGTASGAETSTYQRMDTDLADRFANAATSIYADESRAADNRMMDALRMSAGLSTADADRSLQELLGTRANELGWFNAQTGRDLGLGNLALGNMNAVNNYNLGLANFGLQRDLGLANLDNADTDRLIQLLEQILSGARQSAGGYR